MRRKKEVLDFTVDGKCLLNNDLDKGPFIDYVVSVEGRGVAPKTIYNIDLT